MFACGKCSAPLTNHKELLSTTFTGETGRAFLFDGVVNLCYSEAHHRMLITGEHFVQDVRCKRCNARLGWRYEFASEEESRYKEGKVVLERALILEVDSFEDDDYQAVQNIEKDVNNNIIS